MKIPNEMLGSLGFKPKNQAEVSREVGTFDVAQLRKQVAQLTQDLALERAKRERLAAILRPLLEKARASVPQGRAYRSDGGAPPALPALGAVVVPEVLPPEPEPEPVSERRDIMVEDDPEDDLDGLLG